MYIFASHNFASLAAGNTGVTFFSALIMIVWIYCRFTSAFKGLEPGSEHILSSYLDVICVMPLQSCFLLRNICFLVYIYYFLSDFLSLWHIPTKLLICYLSALKLFCTICIFHPIRVWDIPYAYRMSHTHTECFCYPIRAWVSYTRMWDI